ncbi:MAG: ABC transporter permease [Thermoanaerobaculales bacterium]|jgi:putative ABC transport system permease protein|nr:ABC transporter permease [Thermoanaerobaculales bacterium]
MRFTEGIKMALAAVGAHKLRSALTLVGVIAGVAAIIGTMTGVSVAQHQMESELSVLGATVFQVQKFPPRGFQNQEHDYRKIGRWPPLTMAHADAIRERVPAASLVGTEIWKFAVTASYRGESTDPNCMVCGGTPEYPENNTHYVELGRNISHEDVQVARRVVVLGFNVANRLFPFIDPVGKTIKVNGRKVRVVGVFAEKSSAMGGNFDNYLLMPLTALAKDFRVHDRHGRLWSANITVSARSPELLEEAMEQTRAVLRAARGLSPREEDNFFFFTSDSQIEAFNRASAGVKTGAFVLGIVALVVAGIGIMNIMLVSVTERTQEIGIRKALGAKRRAILVQFLLEAVILCNIGGIIGVAVGFGLGNLVAVFTEFEVHVPVEWAAIGLVFCTVVGLVAGMWPAVRASRLMPIEALQHE